MFESPYMTPAVRRRHNVEKRIVERVVADLLDAGFELAVDDGGDEPHPRTANKTALYDALMNTDEDRLYVYHKDSPPGIDFPMGWVYFVYGNDGWDVICDYTTNLELKLRGALEFAESFE